MERSLTAEFDALAAEARACAVCPKLTDRVAVLSRLNGSLCPAVLFVAEAPGRRGADRTRIPLSGDASARTFEHLLEFTGIRRDEVFITNAVMCNPHSPTGANRPPHESEIRNCNTFLRRVIDLLNPPVVVSLGARALAALARIEQHHLALSRDAAHRVTWYGRTLVPVYHPSPQVIISRRSLAQQERDWLTIQEALADVPANIAAR